MPDMNIQVLLVEPDPRPAERYADWLRADGYGVIGCPGPRPPHYACYMLEAGRCPLADKADLLIYDPRMPCASGQPDAAELVRALRACYPAKPVLLVAPEHGMPPGLIAGAVNDRNLCLLSSPGRGTFSRVVAGLAAGAPAGG